LNWVLFFLLGSTLAYTGYAFWYSGHWPPRHHEPSQSERLSAIHDPRTHVRLRAVEGLHREDLPLAIPELAKHLNDPSETVRDRVVDILGYAGSSAVPTLQQALRDPSPETRIAALA